MGQKKQRLSEAERSQSPQDTAGPPAPKGPRPGLPATPSPQRSIYFSRPQGCPARLGPEFFDQPAVPLARAFLGQVVCSKNKCLLSPALEACRLWVMGVEVAAPAVAFRRAPGPGRAASGDGQGAPAAPPSPSRRGLQPLEEVLARRLPDGTEVRGRVVETEAYVGPEDTAAHSRGGRRTARNRAMFMPPGTLYVYVVYGMYFCMNVSSRGDGACVLLRALEPLGGLDAMRQLRALRRGAAGRAVRDRELCSGPSKLCQALAIDKSFDQRDLAADEAVWLERGPPGAAELPVVAAARVGIGSSGEWARKPLRFYFRGSPWVSVVDRTAEQDAQA